MGYSDFSEGYRKELDDLRSRLQELLLAEWKCKMEGRVKPDTTSQREVTLYRRNAIQRISLIFPQNIRILMVILWSMTML